MVSLREKVVIASVLTDTLENPYDDRENAVVAGLKRTVAVFEALIPPERTKIPRIPNYVEDILPHYNDESFRKRFRMDRETHAAMTEILLKHKGKTVIPMGKQLLIFIKYVSSQMTLQTIADKFRVCEYTVFNIVERLSSIMCEELMPKYIKWPQGEHVSEVVKGFEALKHFPGVIGAIDCSQIQIKTPKYCPENYINRKSFPSVNLQAVCDSNMNILDVHCGWPGSVHDSRVFKNSNLYHRIQNDPDQVFPHNTHLIGDAAFGLETWMMTPFKDYGNLQARQRRYNYLQSSTRMVIERTFGALKGRFRRLKYLDMQNNERIVKVILSCCVLHQFCLKHGDDGTQYIEEGIEEDTNAFVEVMNGATNAEEKRTIIVQNL